MKTLSPRQAQILQNQFRKRNMLASSTPFKENTSKEPVISPIAKNNDEVTEGNLNLFIVKV